MTLYTDEVRDEFERPVQGAQVYVYDTTGALSDLTLSGLPIVNPVISDQLGVFKFEVPDSVKDMEIRVGGALRYKERIIVGSPGADLLLRADLAAPGGAALTSFIQSGSGAVSRTAQAKLRDMPSVKDFGAVGNGVTNDTAAFSAFFAAGGGVVPAGVYALDGTPTTPTGSVLIKGDDATLLIRHGGTRALYFTPALATNKIEITGITLQAAYVTGPCPLGIDIEYPSAASYPYQQVKLDVQCKGDLTVSTAPWANTWSRGLRLKNVWYGDIRLSGSSYPDFGNTGATGAVEVVGGSYGCIGTKFTLNWYYGAVGILGSAYMEGCYLTNGSELVNVTRGWYIPSSTPLGGFGGVVRGYALTIEGAHIAAWTSAVEMDTVTGFRSNGSDIQRSNSPLATNWKGYKFNQCLRPQVIGGVIGGNEALPGVTTLGVEATGANSSHGIIDGVNFENIDTQFSFDASTTAWAVKDNRSTGATADVYSVAGAKHDIRWLKSTGEIVHVSDQLNGPVVTGQYTPVLTGVANVAATSAYVSIFSRIGNMVIVSGRLDLDPTTVSVFTQVGISLPVASDLATAEQCTGAAGTQTQGIGGAIYGDAVNNRAQLNILPNTAAVHGLAYAFQYQVI